jgi:tRNA pseudouridine55 synthase
VRLVSSPGFYVRSFAHDLGVAVGTGAVLEGLERRRSGDFSLDSAVSFDLLARGAREDVVSHVRPMERLLLHWPAVQLTATGLAKVAHGREVRPEDWTGSSPPVRADHVRLVSPEGRLVALAKPGAPRGLLHPVVVFRYNG